jgi:hypothetical protein
MKIKINDELYMFDLFNPDDCQIMADRLEIADRADEAWILRQGMPACWTSREREGRYYPASKGIVAISIHKADCLVATVSIDSGSDLSTVNCSENQADGSSAALIILCHHLLHENVKIEEFLHNLLLLLPLRQRGSHRRQGLRQSLHDNINDILNKEND